MTWFLLLFLLVPIALFWRAVQYAILLRRIKKEQVAQEVQEEDCLSFCQRVEKEEDDNILFMQNLGLEEVLDVNHCTRWIFRDENGKIKSLYDLYANRVPLEELTMVPGAETIGIIPDLYYYREKISRWQMLEDEEEIRKLNNA